jgi:hypothetical protein
MGTGFPATFSIMGPWCHRATLDPAGRPSLRNGCVHDYGLNPRPGCDKEYAWSKSGLKCPHCWAQHVMSGNSPSCYGLTSRVAFDH